MILQFMTSHITISIHTNALHTPLLLLMDIVCKNGGRKKFTLHENAF